jgi:hypothetical protein
MIKKTKKVYKTPLYQRKANRKYIKDNYETIKTHTSTIRLDTEVKNFIIKEKGDQTPSQYLKSKLNIK